MRSPLARRLVGAWRVAITPVNCATGVPVPVAPVPAYLTFGEGGKLIETPANPRFAPGQRAAGHGRWERTGNGAYEAVFEAFVLFDSPAPGPYKKGVQHLEQVIVVSDNDHWNSTSTVDFLDEGGNRIPPSGCAAAAAERLK